MHVRSAEGAKSFCAFLTALCAILTFAPNVVGPGEVGVFLRVYAPVTIDMLYY